MDLSSLLKKDKGKKDKELYWAVVIEPSWVQAGVWEIEDGRAKIVSSGNSIAWKSKEEIEDSIDSALSTAVGDLPEDYPEPKDTVFGVTSAWLSEGNIKPENLETLKDLCEKLSLKPVGFVVLSEAIAHFLKSKEESPLSAVLIGASDEDIEVSVFRLGKLKGTQIVARSVSFFDDILEGLARFPGDEPLPSRFVIYDGREGELEDLKESLNDSVWDKSEDVKFLHPPKIEIFKPKNKIFAAALAGASELAGVERIAEAEDVPDKEHVATIFKTEEVANIGEPSEEVSPEKFGFVVGEDVGESLELKDNNSPIYREDLPLQERLEPEPQKPQVETFQVEATPPKRKLDMGHSFNSLFLKIKSLFSGFAAKRQGKKNYVIFGAIFLVVLGSLFAAWWFVPKATLTVYVSPQKLSERTQVLVGLSGEGTSPEKGLVSGRTVSIDESGEKTKSTTGVKTVGEKAKGSVEIRNGTSTAINLSQGTSIFSAGDLGFEIKNAASVSAALSPSNPGTKTVEVEASDIGADYNLAKDETFKVGNYSKSEVDAVATSDFTGGSSRQASSVSADDIESLFDDLQKELEDKAFNSLSGSVNSDDILIKESLFSDITTKDFSSKEGDETDTLKLSLESEVKAIVVKRQDLYEIAKKAFENKVPDGYVLRENQVDFVFEVSEDDGEYTLDLEITANLLPELDVSEIAKKVTGKLPAIAERYISTIPGYSRAQVKLIPKLPGGLGTLPHVTKKIEVEVAAER